MRLYVANLAAYNEGILHGRWIDLSDATLDEVQTEIAEMLKEGHNVVDGPVEEWAIHDYEGFGPLTLHEFEDLEVIMNVTELVRRFGELALHVVNHAGGPSELPMAQESLEENYAGSAGSLADWAHGFAEETGDLAEIPERWHSYIDFERYARDLEYGGDIIALSVVDEVHVFWNR